MFHASIKQRLQINLTEQKTLRTPTRRICTIQCEDCILQESALYSLQKTRVNIIIGDHFKQRESQKRIRILRLRMKTKNCLHLFCVALDNFLILLYANFKNAKQKNYFFQPNMWLINILEKVLDTGVIFNTGEAVIKKLWQIPWYNS
jgi:hypothetical protein